jgi:phage gp29-like protein
VHLAEISHCNAEMSKLVNGSTLTNDSTGSGGASYALGSVHDGVRLEAVQYDAETTSAARRRCSKSRWCATSTR